MPTTLPAVIVVDWTNDYNYGSGVDALTGEIRFESALVEFEPGVKNKTDQDRSSITSSAEEKWQELEQSWNIRCDCNIYNLPVVASGDVSMSSFYNKSTTAYMIHARRTISYGREVTFATAHKLLPKARELLLKDREQFRHRYGHYYVADSDRVAQFEALLVLQSSQRGHLNKAAERAKVELNSIFSSGAEHSYHELNTDSSVNATMYVQSTSSSISVSSGGNLMKALATAMHAFDKKPNPRPVSATLRHYSTLGEVDEDAFPRTCDVDQAAFHAVHDLVEDVNRAQMLAASLSLKFDREARTTYRDLMSSLQTELLHERPKLVDNTEARKRLAEKASSLRKTFEVLNRRYEIWSLADRDRQRENPEEYFPRGAGMIMQGQVITDPATDLCIKGTEPIVVSVKARLFSEAFDIRLALEKLTATERKGCRVIGYRIKECTPSLCEGVRIFSDNMLLTHDGQFKFLSRFSLLRRNAEWAVEIFYVKAVDYPFPVKGNTTNADQGVKRTSVSKISDL